MDITWGQMLAILGALDAIMAVIFLLRWQSFRDQGAGTPLYARGRDARRVAIIAGASGVIMIAAGLLTPLWQSSIA